jgi:hypothetical protein
MTTILAEAGRRLLDEWLKLLVLPGLLFVAAGVAAARLGQQHALDFRTLTDWITAQLATGDSPGLGPVTLAVAAAVLAAAGAGISVAALGRLTTHLWTARGRTGPLRLLTQRRRNRWQQADACIADAIAAAVSGHSGRVGAATASRDRIALTRPTHPTWIGDRLTAPSARIGERYGLDLATVWPRLWLLIPDLVRTELTAASTALAASARLAGWTVLYAALALYWWPSAIIASAVAVAAYVQSRLAAATLADLTESTVDLYGPELAASLRIPHPGPLTPEIGFVITAALRKDALPAPIQPPSLASRRQQPRP